METTLQPTPKHTYLLPAEVELRKQQIKEVESEINYHKSILEGRLKTLQEEVTALVVKHSIKLNEEEAKLLNLKAYNENKIYALRLGKYITLEGNLIVNG